MATYPRPTAGQFNSPWFQSFLGDYPELAKRSGDPAAFNKFLNNHPKIARRYTGLLNRANSPRPPAPAAQPGVVAPPAPAAQPSVVTTPAAAASPATASAKATIASTLNTYGLGGLTNWVWSQFTNGVPEEQIMLDLRERPEYKTRFAGMAALSAKGRAISEEQYISLERSYASQMRAYGLPAGFYDDPADFSQLIGGEVSAEEFGQRLEMASQVVATDPRGKALRDQLANLYGLTNADGLAVAYWIDPNRGSDIIKRQYQAAQAGLASKQAGFAQLSKTQAELVGAQGFSDQYLTQAFGQLAQVDEFAADLPGLGKDAVTRDDLIQGVVLGNQDAAAKIERTARGRVAEFSGGGGFAAGQSGISGLGPADY